MMEQATSFSQTGKPLIVLLHPHCFSQRDMQWYVPLLSEWDIVAVTPRLMPQARTYDGIPQMPLLSVDQLVGAVKPVQYALDKLVRLRSENLYYYFGLDDLFRRAAIVECLETFHPYCRQALDAKKKYGFKLAFSVHENIAFAHENIAYRRQIKRDAFRQGDAFFALCEQGRNSLLLEGAPEEKVHLSGASVDTDLYAPGDPDPVALSALNLPAAKPDGELTLFFAGRLVWEKGVLDAVEAVGLLVRQGVKARLLIAGDGPEEGTIRERMRRMNLGDQVTLLGRVTRDQMIALYRYADLCLVPSIPSRKWQEQFGCVLIEAMACGCPVVATSSGSIAEVVSGHAVLVAPAQHTELASAIGQLAGDGARRRCMSREGRQHVVRRYDNRVNARRIGDVYRRLSGEGR